MGISSTGRSLVISSKAEELAGDGSLFPFFKAKHVNLRRLKAVFDVFVVGRVLSGMGGLHVVSAVGASFHVHSVSSTTHASSENPFRQY